MRRVDIASHLRASVESLGGTRVRITWPECGHSITQDLAKDRRFGPNADVSFMVRYWTRPGTSIHSYCPKCWRRVRGSMKWIRREKKGE